MEVSKRLMTKKTKEDKQISAGLNVSKLATLNKLKFSSLLLHDLGQDSPIQIDLAYCLPHLARPA